MNSVIVANVFRFFGLALLQGLVFQNVGAGWESFPYLHVIVYPIFILLLPLRTPRALIILLGFTIGFTVDIFYDSLGVHASAAVFTAFVRSVVLQFMEPRGGYNVNYSPTAARMGMGWFLRYSAILMFIHLFFYFSVEAFTFVYIVDILLKTIVSFILSMLFIIIYQVLFNPLD
ncbi:MAG: hypothetical protein H6577_08855 [Lewinellaceae bacterium]|nr:hypothetical protein [Saprospiraceae bacterium]MCB9338222.1 hypothetical protein [Lewinellaceae bacterium]